MSFDQPHPLHLSRGHHLVIIIDPFFGKGAIQELTLLRIFPPSNYLLYLIVFEAARFYRLLQP